MLPDSLLTATHDAPCISNGPARSTVASGINPTHAKLMHILVFAWVLCSQVLAGTGRPQRRGSLWSLWSL